MLLASGLLWGMCLAVGMARPGDLLAWELLAAVPWGAAIWTLRRPARPYEPIAIVLIAAAARALLLLAPPVLSDDVYRYVWDGRVQLAGFDPYAYAPSAPQLIALRDASWAAINHVGLPTLYPPLAQLLFRAVAALWPSPMAFRVLAVVADLVSVLLLMALLRRRGSDARAVVILAWAPLAAVESAVGAHVDAPAIALLVAALLVLDRARPLAAGLLAGLSLCVKPAAALLLPLLAAGRRSRLCAGLAVGLLPFALHARGPLMPSVGEYARRWRHNEALFGPIDSLARAVAGDETRHWPQPLARWATGRDSGEVAPDEVAGAMARLTAVSLWAAVAALVIARGAGPDTGGLLLTGTALLLSPVVHPWYATWLLPFLVVVRFAPLLFLTALVPLGYLASMAAGVRWVEYGIPAVAAIVSWITARRAAAASGANVPKTTADR